MGLFFTGVMFTLLMILVSFVLTVIAILLYGIFKKLDLIIEKLEPVKPSAIKLEFYIDGEKVENMNVRIGKKLKVSVVAKDAAGNVAQIDGQAAFVLSAPAMGTLEVQEDGSVLFTPAGALGDLEIQATVDADLGEGVKTVLGVLPVSVIAGEAVVVELSGAEQE